MSPVKCYTLAMQINDPNNKIETRQTWTRSAPQPPPMPPPMPGPARPSPGGPPVGVLVAGAGALAVCALVLAFGLGLAADPVASPPPVATTPSPLAGIWHDGSSLCIIQHSGHGQCWAGDIRLRLEVQPNSNTMALITENGSRGPGTYELSPGGETFFFTLCDTIPLTQGMQRTVQFNRLAR